MDLTVPKKQAAKKGNHRQISFKNIDLKILNKILIN